ncbi:hypothetical protein AGRA3207_007867 (plasmid) [Actinomadura graeca]|uniref:Uncharacterized protein n=1 Tax=Actinomadura graeca TaxID=2750812 RepID=A0ABX8RDK2_9ACTN|nr:hypothetical protein [Actinomadura graeca]QXJ27068.1 hypothetical protein AGRA3207_007867 [Actinomadura graeca]
MTGHVALYRDLNAALEGLAVAGAAADRAELLDTAGDLYARLGAGGGRAAGPRAAAASLAWSLAAAERGMSPGQVLGLDDADDLSARVPVMVASVAEAVVWERLAGRGLAGDDDVDRAEALSDLAGLAADRWGPVAARLLAVAAEAAMHRACWLVTAPTTGPAPAADLAAGPAGGVCRPRSLWVVLAVTGAAAVAGAMAVALAQVSRSSHLLIGGVTPS